MFQAAGPGGGECPCNSIFKPSGTPDLILIIRSGFSTGKEEAPSTTETPRKVVSGVLAIQYASFRGWEHYSDDRKSKDR